jgi:hypothetical protein
MSTYNNADYVKIEVADEQHSGSKWSWMFVESSNDKRQLVSGYLVNEKPLRRNNAASARLHTVSYDKIRAHFRSSGKARSPHLPSPDRMMLPILRAVRDGRNYRIFDLVPQIGDHFGLSREDRQAVALDLRTFLEQRMGFAISYLKKLGYVEYPTHGFFRSTKKAQQFLKLNPDKLNSNELRKLHPAGQVHTTADNRK